MDSEHSLNRRVAKALGWRVGSVEWRLINANVSGVGYALYAPDGTIANEENHLDTQTADEAWLAVPDWAHDLNAAMTLLSELPIGWTFNIGRYDINRLYVCDIYVSLTSKKEDEQCYVGRHERMAIAICEAWLRYRER